MKNVEYHVWDTCIGEVNCISEKGIFLTLDNGQSALAYGGTSLRRGSRVFCSVLKEASSTKRRMLVSIDSTMPFEEAA